MLVLLQERLDDGCYNPHVMLFSFFLSFSVEISPEIKIDKEIPNLALKSESESTVAANEGQINGFDNLAFLRTTQLVI